MIELVIIFVCLIFSAFFSGSETALTAVSRPRLFKLAHDGNKSAQRAEKLREKKDALIGGILVGNNVVNIAAASIGTSFAIMHWGEEWGPVYATVAMTLLVLIFGEMLPKTIAIHNAERVSIIVAYPLSYIIRILSPATCLVRWFIQGLLLLFGFDYTKSHSLVSATDVIRGTIELQHSEGGVGKSDRDMLGSILDLNDRELSEIMLHRKHVYAINMADEPEKIIEQAINSAHSRIPIYRESVDNIIGVLHVKDVLKLMSTQKVGFTREMIRRAARKPWFVPETTTLDSQMLAFRARRQHFACVVDEYGAFRGIVTLEDIIEEIVGEIGDEHDLYGMENIIPFGPNAWRVDGTVTIRDLNRYLDWNLPDEHANTIAGLIMHKAEMIPEQGAVFEFYNIRFTVSERNGNQITQLIIEPLPAEPDDEEW